MKKLSPTNKKIIGVVFFSVILLSFLIYVISTSILLKSFASIEERQSIQNTERVDDAILDVADQLSVKLTDWAWWDDTYAFMDKKNNSYIESNLGTSSISNLKINAMVFISKDGDIVFEKRVDYKNKVEVYSDSLGVYIRQHNTFANFKNDSTKKGIILLPEGAMIITALPILNSDGEGDVKGVLLFGKFIDSDFMASISTLTHIQADMYQYDQSELPEDVASVKNTHVMNDGDIVVSKPLSENLVAGYRVLHDIYNDPVLILKTETSRDIYNQGKKTMYWFFTVASLIIIFFGLIIITFIEILFIFRFSKLTQEVEEIKKTGNLSLRVTEGKKDEVGMLSGVINDMLEALSKSNIDLEKFKLAVDNVSDQIVITDPEGNVVYGNKVIKTITGYTAEEALGKKAGTLWKAPMPKEYYENMWDVIKNKKETFRSEIQNRRKNGEMYFANISISPVLSKEGKILFFVAIEHDITKEKLIEKKIIEDKKMVEDLVVLRTKELHAEKARLYAAINSLSFGFIILDMNHNVILQNKEMVDLFDLKEESLLNIDKVSELLGDHLNLKMQVQQCFKHKSLCEIKEINFGKKILRGIIAPVLSEGEGTIGYVFLLEDITEAHVLNRSREEFFSIASHELRTPLTAIRGNSQILLDDFKEVSGNTDMKEMVSDIHVSSVRLIGIVNDFLEVSRLEQGRIQIKKEQFDMIPLVNNVMKQISPIAKTNNVTISCDDQISPNSLVNSDKSRVEQVLFNLLGNALKFTNNGTITIRLIPIRGFIKISVIDTGIGISEENQLLLFKKFQQAGDDMLARDVTQGTGLGLYISHLIVSKLGGTIGLEKSVKGEGSIFTFTVPTVL